MEGGTPGLAKQRGLRRKRRQRVLILRLLSGDHPSAPPRTLGPDCPPPARVSPDRISVGRGRTAAPAAGRGEGRPFWEGREFGVPGWGRRRSRTDSVLGSLPIVLSPVLPSKVDERGARWRRQGEGEGGGRGCGG